MWWFVFLLVVVIICVFAFSYYYYYPSSFSFVRIPKSLPQTKALRLTNSLPQDIWVVASCGPFGTPFPGMSTTDLKIPAQSYIDIDIPLEGLLSARIYPKYGCDSNGLNCEIGDSVPVYTGPSCPWPYGCNPTQGQGGPCGSSPCQPPLNSIAGEFTFGCFLSDQTKCATNGNNGPPLGPVTYFDSSAVDGYSLPFNLIVKGNTGTCGFGQGLDLGVNATNLSLKNCPTNINLSSGGITSVTGPNGQIHDLTSVDLRYFDNNGNTIACFSPCEKLTNSDYGFGQTTNITDPNSPVGQYCCPTPPVDAGTCRAGKGADNLYTQSIRNNVPNVYTYAYDDVNALQTCGKDVQYEIVFGSPNASYPVIN